VAIPAVKRVKTEDKKTDNILLAKKYGLSSYNIYKLRWGFMVPIRINLEKIPQGSSTDFDYSWQRREVEEYRINFNKVSGETIIVPNITPLALLIENTDIHMLAGMVFGFLDNPEPPMFITKW
jgi:hypothetical protein